MTCGREGGNITWTRDVFVFAVMVGRSSGNVALRAYMKLIYLLSPRSTDILEKLTGSQLVKKFPAFYGIIRFITAYTSARHLSLFWANSVQSMSTIPLPEYPF
jgi:hypothetical protein